MKEDCIFCKIIAKKTPTTLLYEDDELIVIKDLYPQAPTHLLIIPKEHIATINNIDITHQNLLGKMIKTAKEQSTEQNLSDFGYRLVFNVNSGGGQEIYHIHLHLLGGRQMLWPPG